MDKQAFTRFLALSAALCALSTAQVRADDSSLKGGVDETAPYQPPANVGSAPIEPLMAPVLKPKPKKLQGGVESKSDRPLEGNTSDDDADLQSMKAKSDRKAPLKATASEERDSMGDPDAADQELLVEWDNWRNRFLRSVQANMQEEMNNPDDAALRWDPENQVMLAKFPLGISAWFSCQVSADRRISVYKLVRSSGYPNYDKAVANSVKNLEGSAILKFPSRSHRQMVTQVAGIKTSDTGGGYQDRKFGDTERYTVPGQ